MCLSRLGSTTLMINSDVDGLSRILKGSTDYQFNLQWNRTVVFFFFNSRHLKCTYVAHGLLLMVYCLLMGLLMVLWCHKVKKYPQTGTESFNFWRNTRILLPLSCSPRQIDGISFNSSVWRISLILNNKTTTYHRFIGWVKPVR